jgi:hypothetical protein
MEPIVDHYHQWHQHRILEDLFVLLEVSKSIPWSIYLEHSIAKRKLLFILIERKTANGLPGLGFEIALCVIPYGELVTKSTIESPAQYVCTMTVSVN